MRLRRFFRRLRALVTGRRHYTATFQAYDAELYKQLLAIDPLAAALFANAVNLPTDQRRSE